MLYGLKVGFIGKIEVELHRTLELTEGGIKMTNLKLRCLIHMTKFMNFGRKEISSYICIIIFYYTRFFMDKC